MPPENTPASPSSEPASPSPEDTAVPQPQYVALRFGIDAPGVALYEATGVKPDYATLWVGRWNNEQGWRGTDKTLASLAQQNITPFIHLYYWGDDIHPDCFSVGCNGKDIVGWQRLTQDLVWHMWEHLQGANVTVVLESEFNKHQVKDNEDLDWYLSQRAQELKAGYPATTVVLGLGNWYPKAWPTWDRAAAASDAIGIQAMAGSTRDGEDKQRALFESTLQGLADVKALYDKPLIVHDVAVSSYPEPYNLDDQEEALQEFAEGFGKLRDAGVEVVVYRSLLDVPDMATNNHYGEAERHWGLAWAGSGELKPAGEVWIEAVKQEKAGGIS